MVTAPGAPIGLTATANGETHIDLSWSAPSNNGGANITGYKIEVSTNGSRWSDLVVNTGSTATSYSHTSLAAGSTRHYRVSAINSEGTGPASTSDSATTEAAAPSDTRACATSGAVANPDNNEDLVSECESLLGLKNKLVGTGSLNWSATTVISSWDGIIVGGSPARVTHLELRVRGNTRVTGQLPAALGELAKLEVLAIYGASTDDGEPISLTGSIPAELGNLTNLKELTLHQHEISGTIPAALGNLSKLEKLQLNFTQINGSIPASLGNLSTLKALTLYDNGLSGTLPAELGRLGNLQTLNFNLNRVTGSIPAQFGNLSSLLTLALQFNRLSGSIPTELTGLSSLQEIYISHNNFTGCIPSALQEVAKNDLDKVDLPDCDASTKPDAPTGLTATAGGQTEIDLSWSAPSDDGGADITGYRIEVSTDSTSWSDLVADTNSTSTSYSHTGLTAGSTRHYRVSAINSEGTGPSSGADSATTESPSNSAPTAVGTIPDQVITQGIELKVDVSPYFSDPDDDALSFSIWSPQLFNAESVSGSTASLLLTSLFICDPTTVTITAQDPGGLEATQDFTLRRFNNPPVASSGTFPSQTIDVGETVPLYMGNWFSDTDICDSTLKYSAESSDTRKATVSTSGNTVSVMGEAAGSATITVTAEDGEGLTATLDIQVTVTSAAATKPGTPTGLTATANEQTQIDLSWRAPSVDGGADITGYRIEVSNTGSDWSDLVTDTDSTSTSYTHTGLTAGSTRHYRVSSINSAGTGQASDTDSATTDARDGARLSGGHADRG